MIEDQHFDQAGDAAVIALRRGLHSGLDPRINTQRHRGGLDLWARACHELSSRRLVTYEDI